MSEQETGLSIRSAFFSALLRGSLFLVLGMVCLAASELVPAMRLLLSVLAALAFIGVVWVILSAFEPKEQEQPKEEKADVRASLWGRAERK